MEKCRTCSIALTCTETLAVLLYYLWFALALKFLERRVSDNDAYNDRRRQPAHGQAVIMLSYIIRLKFVLVLDLRRAEFYES